MQWSLARRCRGAVFVAALGVFVGAATAQQLPGDEPRIGLVLSGGGARGCAHVGVLKVLEELRVPIHCIAGTSMGSIVGGCYAYGLSPERLEQEMTRAGNRRPWALLLQDQPVRSERTFRRKQEEFEFLVDVGLGYRDGAFRLPKGLVQGQNLELELLALTVGAHDLASFDLLPIPFRAVAVELRTGDPVVLQAGNLAMAMRASMSLPGIFAPAVLDGEELLDGGLVDNLPVEVARKELGATRLIVVDIGTPVAIEAANSALAVSTQMVQILGQQNVDKSLSLLGPDDVFIQPDLGDISSADFERAAESIRIGEAAARAVADRLRELSVDDATYARFLSRQRRSEAPVTVRAVRIDNRSGLGDALIRSRVHVEPGRVLDLAALHEDIDRIYGLGNFESVTFELLPVADGLHDLVLHVTEKSWGPTYIKFALALESNLEGRSAFGLGTQVNVRELNDLGAEWRSAFRIGDSTSLASEFYQPVVPSGALFVAPRVEASRQEAVASAGVVLEGRLYSAGLDVGANLGQWGELRVGVARITGDVDVSTLLVNTGFDIDDGVLQGKLVVDTLDDASFPSSGVRAAAIWTGGFPSLGADSEYQQVSTAGVGYVSSGATTFGLGALFESALADPVPIYRTSVLGGFTRLSGLERASIGGQHAGLVGLLVRHRVAGRASDAFGFPLYVGGTIETGNVWDRRDDVFRTLRLSGSLFAALSTPIGPTYLAYGYAEGGEQSFYLFVGQVF